MKTAIALLALSTSLLFASTVEAAPKQPRCGDLKNPKPGAMCYTVRSGGGKVAAGGSPQKFPGFIVQATEPEYVIADAYIEITSAAGDRTHPTISELSAGGEARIIREARQKHRDFNQKSAEIQAKAQTLSGPALVEAKAKIRALQEEERSYESYLKSVIAAGQDAGKYSISDAEARPRKCGWGNLDKCGSWVEYNVYVIKRYVGDPIAAYNRAFAVAQDAQQTIDRLVAQNQSPPVPAPVPAPLYPFL